MSGVEISDEAREAAEKRFQIKASLGENYPTPFAIYRAGRQPVLPRAKDAKIAAFVRQGKVVHVRLKQLISGKVELTLPFQ